MFHASSLTAQDLFSGDNVVYVSNMSIFEAEMHGNIGMTRVWKFVQPRKRLEANGH